MRKALLIAAGLFLHPYSAYAQRGGYRDMHDWMMGYGYGGWLMWLLFLILIGAVIYFVMQGARNRGNTHGRDPDPSTRETWIDVLKKRYASGELTKEEYEKMKKDLGS